MNGRQFAVAKFAASRQALIRAWLAEKAVAECCWASAPCYAVIWKGKLPETSDAFLGPFICGAKRAEIPGRKDSNSLPEPLEGEDWTSFFADIVPLAGMGSLKERQCRQFLVGVGGIERLLVGE